MGEKIYFLSGDELGVVEEGKEKLFDSKHVEQYKNTVLQIAQKSEWKNNGASAMFQEKVSESPSLNFRINSICPFKNKQFLYSVDVGNSSGIFARNIEDDVESHIIHSQKEHFFDLDYNSTSNRILTSISTNGQTKDIAFFDLMTNDLKQITSGDSVDETPSYSPFNGNVLFSSRGIARGNNFASYVLGPSSIYEASEDGRKCDEIASDNNFDLIAPRHDSLGNLYYIKKPLKKAKKPGLFSFLLDIILLPFRLIYGLFKMLFYLGNLSTKDKKRNTSRTDGNNPSKFQEGSERDLFILDEKIKTEEASKENKKTKDKLIGYAPKRFQLIKQSKDSMPAVIKEGVLSFTIDPNNNIIFSNGKHIIKIEDSGELTLLHTKKLLSKCCVESSPIKKLDGIFDF